jgi:threonine dehydratase
MARDAYDSLQKNDIQPQYPPVSIADGLRTSLGSLTFKIIRENVALDDVLLVSEDEIIEATKLVFERMKLVIEPSSATVVAAVLKYKERFQGKKVCCIISGGNVEMDALWKDLKGKVKS